MNRISPEQLGSDLDALLRKNEETVQASRKVDTEDVHNILGKMDQAPLLPVPESLADYPEAISNYFQQNSSGDTIEFRIPLFHVEDQDSEIQKNLLAAIGSTLRRSIFEYCRDLIESVPEHNRELVKLPIGETILDIRHSQETGPIHSIYVYVKKESGHIFLNIINPSNYDPEAAIIDRAESGSLLVPLAANLGKDEKNPEDKIDIHKQISKVITDAGSTEPEIIATDCKVDIRTFGAE